MPKNWIGVCLICSKASSMILSVISCPSSMTHKWSVLWTSLCMYSCNGMTLLAFSLFHIINLQCFCLFILCKLELNRCCCVKYTWLLIFLIFYISQGRRVAYLRCNGRCYISSVANFMLSSAVKEFFEISLHLPKLRTNVEWHVFPHSLLLCFWMCHSNYLWCRRVLIKLYLQSC